jgi:hypothetical protein
MTEINDRNAMARVLVTAFEAGAEDLKRYRTLCATATWRAKTKSTLKMISSSKAWTT